MKKLSVAVALIVASVFYIYSRKPAIVPSSIQTEILTSNTTPASGYKDGTYTGSVVDAFYGTVQVRATIANGSLADVAFLSYPSDRSNSRYINGQAMPMLIQEAIQAQSADVNTVSGATATSGAFRQSLATALASAKY